MRHDEVSHLSEYPWPPWGKFQDLRVADVTVLPPYLLGNCCVFVSVRTVTEATLGPGPRVTGRVIVCSTRTDPCICTEGYTPYQLKYQLSYSSINLARAPRGVTCHSGARPRPCLAVLTLSIVDCQLYHD